MTTEACCINCTYLTNSDRCHGDKKTSDRGRRTHGTELVLHLCDCWDPLVGISQEGRKGSWEACLSCQPSGHCCLPNPSL
jgi:hypothetical protein